MRQSKNNLTVEDFLSPSFSNQRLIYLTEMEKISLSILKVKKEINSKEERRDKFKDLMTQLKEGKVQKDMKFWHYFEDNLFVKMSRKESVSTAEKEIGKLTTELSTLKKKLEELKSNLMDLINQNLKFGGDVSDLDEEVARIMVK
jgi:hypothetical protein